jgi:hypothetical protein
MNPIEAHCNEQIFICPKQGVRTGPFAAVFDNERFTLFDESLEINPGDCVERVLGNGRIEKFDVGKVHYEDAFQTIPASVEVWVVPRQVGLAPARKGGLVQNIPARVPQNPPAAAPNSRNIIESLKLLYERIEHAAASPEDKQEAKSRLRAVLENPLISSLVGGTAGEAVKPLKPPGNP